MKRTIRFQDTENRFSPIASKGDEIWPVSARRKAPSSFKCIRGCGCFFKERCWDYEGHSEADKAEWARERDLRAELRSIDRKKKIARLEALQQLESNKVLDEKTSTSSKGAANGGLGSKPAAEKDTVKVKGMKPAGTQENSAKEEKKAAAAEKRKATKMKKAADAADAAKVETRRAIWQRYMKHMSAADMVSALLKRSNKYKVAEADGVIALCEKMMRAYDDQSVLWCDFSWDQKGVGAGWYESWKTNMREWKFDPEGPQPPASGSPKQKPTKSGKPILDIAQANAEIHREKAAERERKSHDEKNRKVPVENISSRETVKATVSVNAVTAAVTAGNAEDEASVCYAFCQEQGIPWAEKWCSWDDHKRVDMVQALQSGTYTWTQQESIYDGMKWDGFFSDSD